ncbi:hypothetical protein ACFTXM_20140 [Streptomyces sp. NPDC056930]|uniref:hypothetical protein n=1 Tax=Streptomyces sp. NPDC056930 TaxID=3345967 RepID=UPI00363CE6A3
MVSGAYEEAVAQLRRRYRLSAMTAGAYAGEGWTAVAQDVVLGEELAGYVELVRARPLYVVVLAPDPRVVAERSKNGYGAGWTVESLDRVLREQTPRIGLWLDTTGQSAEQTVDAVLAELGRARVVGAAES